MKVILLAEVKALGKKGDVVEVAKGHARNFLLPRKLAMPVTEGNLKTLEQIKQAEAKKEEAIRVAAEALAAKLADQTVKIEVKAGKEDKLYGSVTSKDIAEALKEQSGIEVDKKSIDLSEPIKTTGEFNVTLKLYHQVEAEIKVNVLKAKSKEE